MRSFRLPLFALVLLEATSAHYLFGRLILGGIWTKTWEYVREVSPAQDADSGVAPSTLMVTPNTEPNSLDLRCGRNASTSWSQIKTAIVQAGDTVGFAAGEPMLQDDVKPWMYHPGFASAWLSKAPNDNLKAYKGDGDWFKILSVTGRTAQSLNYSDPQWASSYNQFKSVWGTFKVDSWNFTIPKTTPPGSYLLRFEHIFPNAVDAQFYVNCAHVQIVNNGNAIGVPSPLVKIPGVYQRGQPDVYFSVYDQKFDINKFVAPKPEVWLG